MSNLPNSHMISANLSMRKMMSDIHIRLSRGDSSYLANVTEQTPALCLAAVRSNPNAIGHVRALTEELCLEAVNLDGLALEHIPRAYRTAPVVAAAIRSNPKAKFI